jgi:hypothetical protein
MPSFIISIKMLFVAAFTTMLVAQSVDHSIRARLLNPHRHKFQDGVTLSVMVHAGSKHLDLFAEVL